MMLRATLCRLLHAAAHGRRGAPLSSHLAAFAAAILLPCLSLAGFLLYQTAASGRARLEGEARGAARDIAFVLERELAGMTATLQALATAPSLQSDDLALFDRRAREL